MRELKTGGIARRSVLIVGVASLTAASNGPYSDVPAIARPMTAAPPAPKHSIALKPISYWTTQYEQSWDYQTGTTLPQSRSGDSWDHYNLCYLVDANTAMFGATEKTRYLDRALAYVENVYDTAARSSAMRTSQYHDHYRGWVSNGPDLDRPGMEVPLFESYFWRYASTLLRVMRQTPEVYADPKYRARYDKLLTMAEVDVFEKWYTRGTDNLYRSRTHMASHWALIALNLALITTDAARRKRYRQVVDNIDQHLPNVHASLRGQLRRNPKEPTAYFWSDVWGSYRHPGQDVAHANGVIAYIAEARDNGGFWTDTDMAAFAALLNRVVWPGRQIYPAYVDGSGKDNGWFSDGFVKLGRYDPALHRRLETHLVQNEQFAANMALNVKVLAG
jgi:hypothetical protein